MKTRRTCINSTHYFFSRRVLFISRLIFKPQRSAIALGRQTRPRIYATAFG